MLTYIDTLMGFAGVMLLLSLLVTAIVQAASALLNLRGRNLAWGVALLVGKAIPALDEKGREEVAEKILTDPTLSPWRRLATAIRSDELLRILPTVCGRNAELSAAFTKAKESWPRVYAAIPDNKAIEELFPEDVKAAEKVLAKLQAKAQQDLADFKAWFDTVMDRSTERFVTWTRAITVVVAAALAVGLQVDSLGLLEQIAQNPELRARLAQQADATLKLADEVKLQEVGPAKSALDAALEAVKKEDKALSAIGPTPDGLITYSSGARWITANVPEASRPAVLKAYDAAYDKALPARIKDLDTSTKKITERLGDAGLTVVAWKNSNDWWAFWSKAEGQGRRIAGVILTIAFLSLGGPFWYNLLRQLANLRPLLAGKIDRDEGRSG